MTHGILITRKQLTNIFFQKKKKQLTNICTHKLIGFYLEPLGHIMHMNTHRFGEESNLQRSKEKEKYTYSNISNVKFLPSCQARAVKSKLIITSFQ